MKLLHSIVSPASQLLSKPFPIADATVLPLKMSIQPKHTCPYFCYVKGKKRKETDNFKICHHMEKSWKKYWKKVNFNRIRDNSQVQISKHSLVPGVVSIIEENNCLINGQWKKYVVAVLAQRRKLFINDLTKRLDMLVSTQENYISIYYSSYTVI